MTLQIFAAVGDAIDGDQHLGADLLKAIQHRVGAHVGRTHAPNAANAGDRQKRHHGFGNIGQIRCHALAWLHALRLQMQSQRRHLALQLGPRHFTPLTAFVVADDGGHARRMGGIHMAQHLLGIVHLRTNKPPRTRHDIALQHTAVRRGRLKLQIVPSRLPKVLEVRHRPPPQGLVIVKLQLAMLGQPLLVKANLRHKGWRGAGSGVHGY